MFKRLAKLFFLLLISISLISVSPIFAQKDNQNNKKVEEYETYLEHMRKEIAKRNITLMVITPKREGRDAKKYGSGFAVLEKESQAEDINGEVIKYRTYYIASCPHVVSDEEWDLEEYYKHNVRIFVLGKNNEAPAQLIAWEWQTASALFRVDIPEDELEDFKIQVVKIAKELPGSQYDSKYSDENVSTVYLSGSAQGRPVAPRGYISRYLYNYKPDGPDGHTCFVKIAEISVEGLSGPGQSGAAVFNRNLEVVGVYWGGPPYTGSNSAIIIPIDVIVERFLKKIPELKSLDLPKFELERLIKDKPAIIGKPANETIKQEDNDSKK